MSIANLNQFPNEVMQDSALQDQFNTAAAVQELSDAELESVAGGVVVPWFVGPALGLIGISVGTASLAVGLVNLFNGTKTKRSEKWSR